MAIMGETTCNIRELELSSDAMTKLIQQAMERILEHIESLPTQPVSDVTGGEDLARSVMEPMPEQGAAFADLLELLFGRLVPKTFNTASPGYLAYIPGGGLFHAAIADLIADSINRYVGVWMAAPALAQLEANVLRWFADMIGYPGSARGLLTTGGSLANFTALVAARRERLPEDFLSGVLYASDQSHHSVIKAALLAGFPERNLHKVPVDGHFRIRIDALRETIASDRARGHSPFLIVASAGTTNTGAVDDLEALANVARDEDLWLHVDAAYGGFFMLTKRGKSIMRGIERADSVALDPHKALFLPYGTGSLLVRNGEALRRAHTVNADYMPPMQDNPDLVDFCQYSPELSRDFRGLRVWLPFKMHGAEAFRHSLDEKLDLAAWVTEEFAGFPAWRLSPSRNYRWLPFASFVTD
jgi:aromatic-L-amino-acid decarboxylase